jgi:sugar phosphate isomerase/epimerase
MIVALHAPPKSFFKTNAPHSNGELVSFVRKVDSLGFKAVQIGPLADYVRINGAHLKKILDGLNIERNVHVGGIYDAERFALTEAEYAKVWKQIRYGMMLCKEMSSTLVSIHPPLFTEKTKTSEELLAKAQTRFLRLVKDAVDFAGQNKVKIALESFCYNPFIFEGLNDFAQFISYLPSEKLGVLLEVGHLYQIGISPYEAVQTFKNRIFDVHVHDATKEKDYKKATHLPVGKGKINFASLIKCLREVGYDGWLTLEIRGTEEEIVESKQYLEHLISEIAEI